MRWTRRSTRNLAAHLTDVLHLPACPRTVARLLRALGYSLRVNHKCIPSCSPAERNDQFEFIDQLRRDCARLHTNGTELGWANPAFLEHALML